LGECVRVCERASERARERCASDSYRERDMCVRFVPRGEWGRGKETEREREMCVLSVRERVSTCVERMLMKRSVCFFICASISCAARAPQSGSARRRWIKCKSSDLLKTFLSSLGGLTLRRMKSVRTVARQKVRAGGEIHR